MNTCEVCGDLSAYIIQDIVEDDPVGNSHWRTFHPLPVHYRCLKHPRASIQYYLTSPSPDEQIRNMEAGILTTNRVIKLDDYIQYKPMSDLPISSS